MIICFIGQLVFSAHKITQLTSCCLNESQSAAEMPSLHEPAPPDSPWLLTDIVYLVVSMDTGSKFIESSQVCNSNSPHILSGGNVHSAHSTNHTTLVKLEAERSPGRAGCEF